MARQETVPREQALLDFDALQFTGNHFGYHMRFVHRFIRQHRLVDDEPGAARQIHRAPVACCHYLYQIDL